MGIFNSIFGRVKTKSSTNNYRPDFKSMTKLGQISSMFDWIFNPDSKIAKDCAETIHRLLTSQTALENNTLYHSLRHIHLKKKHLKRFYSFETDIQNSLFCVASMNSNGYVREEALTFLIKSPTEKTFPFILFRLADWVPTIRYTAESGIRNFILQRDPHHLIRHHKIINWLLKVNRVDLQTIYQEITQYIFTEVSINQTIRNLEDYNEGDRYFIFKNLITYNKVDSQILEKIIADKNYLIRLLAVQNIDLIERPEILKRLLSDKSQKIRNYALNKISEFQLEIFSTDLNDLIFDDSATIRATARKLLSTIQEQNYLKKYREEVIRSPKPGSIIGLSEVGNESDLRTLFKFLTSDSSKERAAGLLAISNLDYEKSKEEAFELINDTSSRVKKTCFYIIPKEKSFDDLSKLRSIYDQGTNDTKRFTLKVISRYGGWDIVGDFLKGINEADEKINQAAFSFLNRWYDYSVRLAIDQKKSDKEYVLGIYRDLNFEKCETPIETKKIIDRIPFIFGEK